MGTFLEKQFISTYQIFIFFTCTHTHTHTHTYIYACMCQAPLCMGFSQQEYWSELLCPPGDLPDPGIEPCLLHLLHWQEDSLLLVPPWNPIYIHIFNYFSNFSYSNYSIVYTVKIECLKEINEYNLR